MTRDPSSDLYARLRKEAVEALPRLLGSVSPEAAGFQGGLGRGWVDSMSDIDVVLGFGSEEAAAAAPRGEVWFECRMWSIFTLCFERVSPRRWQDKQRYAYAYETDILWDQRGRLATVCLEARLSPEEQSSRLVYAIKKIGNIGVAYRGVVGREWRGILWRDRPDLWVQRGDLYAAHVRLNQAHELLVDLLFALNGLPVPSKKWRHHLVTKLPILPQGCGSRLRQIAAVRAFSPAEFRRRCEVTTELLTDCVDVADQLGLLPDNLGAAYRSATASHSDDTA